jgi:anti-sigma B factor antagonist
MRDEDRLPAMFAGFPDNTRVLVTGGSHEGDHGVVVNRSPDLRPGSVWVQLAAAGTHLVPAYRLQPCDNPTAERVQPTTPPPTRPPTVSTLAKAHVPSLRMERKSTADGVLVRVAGELDVTTLDEFTTELTAARVAAAPPTPVLLDMRGIEFMGSSALAVLVTHHHRCASSGTPLRVVADQRAVLRPLALTGLATTLEVTATIAAAVNRAS